MFRMRRYRAFLLIAALSAASLYYLVSVRHATLSDVDRLRHFTFGQKDLSGSDYTGAPPSLSKPYPSDPEEEESPTFAATTTRRIAHTTLDDLSGHTPTTTAAEEAETVTGEELLLKSPEKDDGLKEITESQYESEIMVDGAPTPRWRHQPEHNPVPKDQLIRLPSGTPKVLPKVQYDFGPETTTEKSDRLRKLVAVREAFKHAWQGYERFAMPHDELLPMSKSYSDSFMGWGATLIDSLDALWILDMKEEFERAVNATKKVDFKTSHKKEIPIFETVIRLLGGLISAYDLSAEQYPVLLDKAVELAEIIMGAFDTPNRMPDMYYKWAPSYASQQHRSGTHVVLAELGSLSMEFTRLAQITKKAKYYDAIARIQNALEEWQMKTDMPGLWPLTLDASGCKKVDKVKVQTDTTDNSEKPILIDSAQISEDDILNGETPADLPGHKFGDLETRSKRQADDISIPASFDRNKDGHTYHPDSIAETIQRSADSDDTEPEDPHCVPQGLNYVPYAKKHRYTIAAQADSTYEYMPKMYRLLGGLNSQYESMYRDAAKVIREKILYRPMIMEQDRKILFPAQYEFDLSKKGKSRRVKTEWEATHLGCFAGGMFGLAAKTFGVPSDMEIAKQLTDGCVWAYESTPTKIMPEDFSLTPCKNFDLCPWDEVKWHSALDPHQKERMDAVDAWNKEQKKLFQQPGMNAVKDSKKLDAASKAQGTAPKEGIPKDRDSLHQKRDKYVDVFDDEESTRASTQLSKDDYLSLEQSGFMPKVAMSHNRYVKARIQEERLPPTYTNIRARYYILRPEAIESVFIMWRITGEDYWRQKGWNMFQAIQEATHTEVGNAGLEDVTSVLGIKRNKMESFWLAETLKYAYLLFSEPSIISLDDYVLNTEAHPFKVPKP